MDTFVRVEIQFNSIIVFKALKIVEYHSLESTMNGLDYRLKLSAMNQWDLIMFNHY